jgi:ankyrin repeat protein
MGRFMFSSHYDKSFHKRIIQLMQKLGYTADEKGICHGIAMMAIQACSVGDMETFNERLAFIQSRPNLIADIQEVKSKLAQRSMAANSNKLLLSDDEQKIIDVNAFFDGVEMYQKPFNHADLFGQPLSQCNNDIISEYAASQKMDAHGYLIKSLNWSGIYKDEELIVYCALVNEIAKSMQQSFSLLLGSDDHSITLYYDSALSEWYTIDANNLPIRKIHILDLARWIKNALLEKSHFTAFETTLYLPGIKLKNKERVEQIMKESLFNKLLQITKEKTEYVNGNGASVAYIAAQYGRAAVMQALRAAGADLNQARNTGATPAFIAAQNGHAAVIQALHAAGADLNQADNTGATPAFIAAQNGQVAVIQALHAAGADLNQANNNGVTPAFIAAQCGQAAVIQALRAAGADLNQARNDDGLTPAFSAAHNGHTAVIQALHAAGADLNQANNTGVTPAFIAAHKGHVAVLKALDEAGVDLEKITPFGTPLDYIAKLKKATDCIQYLQDYHSRKISGANAKWLSSPINSVPKPDPVSTVNKKSG